MLLGLGGCASDLKGPEPQLYRLDFSRAFTLALPNNNKPNNKVEAVIAVDKPQVSGKMAGNRLSVSLPENRQNIIAGVGWVDNIPNLLQQGLAERLVQSGVFPNSFAARPGVRSDFMVKWNLLRFEAVYAQSPIKAAPTAIVEAEFFVVSIPTGKLLGRYRHATEITAKTSAIVDIVNALETASISLFDGVAPWLQTVDFPFIESPEFRSPPPDAPVKAIKKLDTPETRRKLRQLHQEKSVP
ncbi:MAG: ABC-type transport auxiliary lipoprotein family protein [Alphaproteobacteria bacterium]